jgi:hypothetical protein
VARTALSRLIYLGALQSWRWTRIMPRDRYAWDRLRHPGDLARTLARHGLRSDDVRAPSRTPGPPIASDAARAARRHRRRGAGAAGGMRLAPAPDRAKNRQFERTAEADHPALDPDLPHRSIVAGAHRATIDTIAPTNAMTPAFRVRRDLAVVSGEHVAGPAWTLCRRALPGVLLGLLLQPTLEKPAFTVQLCHRRFSLAA